MENLRVRLTRTLIKNALFELLVQKRIEDITIIELCKQATVNRSTFYKYYGCQNDVLDELIGDFFNELESKIDITQETVLFSKNMLSYILERKSFCEIMIDKIPQEKFSNRLIEFSIYDDTFKALLSNDYTEQQKEHLLKYYQHGCFGIMSYWIRSENPIAIEELYDIMHKLKQNIMFK